MTSLVACDPLEAGPKQQRVSLQDSKRTLKNLRLKTDRKRLIEDDGFQTLDKRHGSMKIGKKIPSLPPTGFQTFNSAQAPPPTAESSDSEIEDEEAGESNPTAVGPP
ncbi:hypothetical protein TNIN_453301 [Trichonephila inaurata madagascariensis]|uniref:Uncharacterized protein n=1 Tax=Trichonephila inaurata madagascariensis TaxID=2747483 RepID=A0A8X6YVP8_9ARAC|nr:hypothetical protein TNIN_453301 [Trichonephila inaurata madagascariensis]